MQDFDARKLRVHYDQLSSAEYLIGFGFRCWLAGYQNNDISYWGKGWSRFSDELGSAKAKPIVTDLSFWVQQIKCCARRKIDCAPIDCKAFCQDECTAVSLIAASQHKACPALQACANALLGTDETEDVLNAAERFASTLRRADIYLDGTALLH
ncbi:MAG: hypothetical protein AAF228_05125 [Pseudomonadota bacterium]